MNDGTLENVVRHGESQVQVDIEMSSGTVVSRIRDKNTNRFIVNGKTIDNPGRTILDEIAETCKILPVSIGANDLENIQFSNPYGAKFMVGLTGPGRHAFVSAMGGADRIRPAWNDAKKDGNALKKSIEDGQKEVADLTSKIQEMDWVQDAQDKLAKIHGLSIKIDDIQSVMNEIKTLNEIVKEARGADNRRMSIQRAREKLANTRIEFEEVYRILVELRKLVDEVESYSASITKSRAKIFELSATIVEKKEELRSYIRQGGECEFCGTVFD